ncbi:MAG: response regulator transcription factor, partial [Thermomicrobiales bacterium]
YAPAAARRAAGLRAHREAAAQYARALRFAGQLPDDQREPLLDGWFRECFTTGQLADAIAAKEALLVIARRAGNREKAAESLAWLASTLVLAGRNAEAEEASQSSLDELDGLPPGPAHVMAYRTQAHLRMLNRDSVDAVMWGERGIVLAERFGEVESLISILNSVGAARLLMGDDAAGRADIERSRELADEAGLDLNVAAALTNLGSAYGEIYRLPLAEHYLREGIAYATERDLDSMGIYMVAWLALTRLYLGHWTEATDLAGSVLRHPNPTAISRMMALVALGRVRARRGDPEVWAALDGAWELAAPTGTLQRIAPVRAARAEAAWLAGDRQRAAAEARVAYDLALQHDHRWHIGDLGYWLWRTGHIDAPPSNAAEPFAFQIAGDWAGAAAAWAALDCPYEEARALADADEEEPLRRALAIFERLGARPMAAMVGKRLRDLGARGIPRGPRPATRANPANLTAREAEILSLISDGLRNAEIADRLFLSPKTVEHHVSAIFAKLGVASRADAMRQAAQLGLSTQSGGTGRPR